MFAYNSSARVNTPNQDENLSKMLCSPYDRVPAQPLLQAQTTQITELHKRSVQQKTVPYLGNQNHLLYFA